MPQVLTSSLTQSARPQSVLAQDARPQAGGFSREYEFGQFIVTFADVQIETFDGDDLKTFSV